VTLLSRIGKNYHIMQIRARAKTPPVQRNSLHGYGHGGEHVQIKVDRA